MNEKTKNEKVFDHAETSAAHRSKVGGGGGGAPMHNNRLRRRALNVGGARNRRQGFTYKYTIF